MKIVMVTKFPPLEGGMSARGYYLAKSLAERGHKVAVVTNAAHASPNERVKAPLDELLEKVRRTENLTLRFAEQVNEDYYRHPMSNPAASALASMAIAAAEAIDADIIYGAYLEPYGVAAHTAGSLTGLPVVLNHAGSDVGRLLASRDLGTLLVRILQAHPVITVPNHARELERHGCAPQRIHALQFPLPYPASQLGDVPPLAERPRRLTIAGKLSALTPLTVAADLAERHGYELDIIGDYAWKSSAPSDLAAVSARPHVTRKGFVWPWRLESELVNTRALTQLSVPGEKLVTHSGAVALEAVAAGALTALPHAKGSVLSLPPSAYCASFAELDAALAGTDQDLQRKSDMGREALQNNLGKEGALCPFPRWVERVEDVLAASVEPGGQRRRVMGPSQTRFQPALLAARGRGAVDGDTALVRRVPVVIAPTEDGRWLVDMDTVGFIPRQLILSAVGVQILHNADGSSTLSDQFDGQTLEKALRAATLLLRQGVVTQVNELSRFDPVPDLQIRSFDTVTKEEYSDD